jgi:hypothetical protein
MGRKPLGRRFLRPVLQKAGASADKLTLLSGQPPRRGVEWLVSESLPDDEGAISGSSWSRPALSYWSTEIQGGQSSPLVLQLQQSHCWAIRTGMDLCSYLQLLLVQVAPHYRDSSKQQEVAIQ